MSRQSREIEAIRIRREAEKVADMEKAGMKPCGKCGTFTEKKVGWVDLSKSGGDRIQEVPACALPCAIQIAGEDNFHKARWG